MEGDEKRMTEVSLKVETSNCTGEIGTFWMKLKETSEGSRGKKNCSADTLYWKVFVDVTPVAATDPVSVAVVRLETVLGRPERTYVLFTDRSSVTPAGRFVPTRVALQPDVDDTRYRSGGV
jgi:hypothetical protein